MMDGHGMGASWTLVIFAVALPAMLLAAGLILALLWPGPAAPRPAGADPLGEAEQVLATRFARGDIQTEDYEQRLHTLRACRR
jgi:putative membrane protein